MRIMQVADQLYQWAGAILAAAVVLLLVKIFIRAVTKASSRRKRTRRVLAAVRPDYEFARKALLNKSETRIFRTLRALVDETVGAGAVLLAQVSYGEFLQGRTDAADRTVHGRRADFVILGADLEVLCVIEYQGTGHYGSTWKSRERAKNSDEIKRNALRCAGIPLIELPAKSDARMIKVALEKAVAEKAKIAENSALPAGPTELGQFGPRGRRLAGVSRLNASAGPQSDLVHQPPPLRESLAVTELAAVRACPPVSRSRIETLGMTQDGKAAPHEGATALESGNQHLIR